MSGWLAEANLPKALKVGAVDYLSKPFRAETILQMVSGHIPATQSMS
jgi:CheY-like chemotaxis protein